MDAETSVQFIELLRLYREWQRTKKRRFPVHPINQRRKELGQFHTLYEELCADEARFRLYSRMSLTAFRKLLELVQPALEKRSRRESISPAERLVICLRYLSNGDSYSALSANFRIGISTACEIVKEVCAVLVQVLAPIYLTTPRTEEEWRDIADGFLTKWQLPNALGAVDGKHVRVKAPANSGSLYYNNKQFFSLVLMIVADHRSRIVYAHFGSYGHESDAGIFDRSDFHRLINDDQNPLNLPPATTLPGSDVSLPHYFIADGAFPLQMHIQRPFSQRNLTDEKRIYNYRVSRARRVVESTFGIMAAKWRLLRQTIETTIVNADMIVKAICCLHNFLVAEGESGQFITEDDMCAADEALTQAAMRNAYANRAPVDVHDIQNALVAYFNGVGAVPWQDEMI